MKLLKRLSAIFGVFLGIGFVAWGVGWERIAIAGRNWPTVEGVVVGSRLVNRKGLRADVVYEYAVAGTRYLGDRVSLDVWADKVGQRARYVEGYHMPVHYSPSDPALSILEPGGHRGLVIILSGAYLVVEAVRRLRK
jgi:Protein of unknown function (DUF3592)